MTLPDTSFVCENIDVEAGTRHWVEVIEGDDWEDMPPGRRMGLMQVAEAIIAAALGEVIPAEAETEFPEPDGCPCHGGNRRRYASKWQPVVSDKE
jgi:hypothetical protein